jgi:hypothetical protein
MAAVATIVFLVVQASLAHRTIFSYAASAIRSALDAVPASNRREGPIRVACVGDSITELGACLRKRSKKDARVAELDSYVAQLSRLLGPAYEVTNYGNSGKTLLKGGLCGPKAKSKPCSYWNTSEFGAALESDPDIVTIMLGTNDAKRCNWYGPPNGSPRGGGVLFFSDYLDLLQTFSSLPSAPKLYIAVPPPLVPPPGHPGDRPPFDMDGYVINDEFLSLVPSVAVEFSNMQHVEIGVIDVWSALGGTKGYENSSMTCDGCHPEKAANAIIARSFATAIASDALLQTAKGESFQTTMKLN